MKAIRVKNAASDVCAQISSHRLLFISRLKNTRRLKIGNRQYSIFEGSSKEPSYQNEQPPRHPRCQSAKTANTAR
jgi:hypothetical protein